MKPNRTFPSVPDNIRDWTRFLSQLLYARTFDTTLLGCTTEPTGTCRYTVSAGIVTLAIPEITATSNSVNAFLESLPEEITPEHDQQCLARIVDNGTTAVGLVQVGNDTGLTLYKNLDAGSFTNFGTKGIKASIICYPLD